MRLSEAVANALVRKRASRRKIAVLDPAPQFLGRAAPDVAADVRLGADLEAEPDEFVGSKAVVFHRAAPVEVHALGAMGSRPNTVAPVIVVGKASIRPAKHRHAKFTKILDNLFSVAIDVRKSRSFGPPT